MPHLNDIVRRHAGGDRARPAPIRLAVFDLDGTLTRSGTSVLRHLGHAFGFAAEAEDLIAHYAARRIDNAQVSRTAASRLRGRARTELQHALATLPMVHGIAETVDLLRGWRVCSALATITFDVAAQYVAGRVGISHVAATALEWSRDDHATGRVADVLESEDKCCFIERLCADLGITSAQVLVVGDAHSDIPAMRLARWSVGYNPTPEVARLASVSVHDSTDLRDMVPHIRDLLDDG